MATSLSQDGGVAFCWGLDLMFLFSEETKTLLRECIKKADQKAERQKLSQPTDKSCLPEQSKAAA
jgi:hypothetical protein